MTRANHAAANRAAVVMAIVQSAAGKWTYCPLLAVPILAVELEYGDGEFPTAIAAIHAMQRDATVPANAETRTYSAVKFALADAAKASA